ncbi:MAG: T9SS type A sorting domain-containing protein [Cytophagales bacterium]|nr:T9SS type A sorting domain-containing protein [Cytophagales bacterium]
MKKTNRTFLLVLIAIITGFFQIILAREISDTIRYKSNNSYAADNKSMALCAPPSSLALLDINNVRATMLNAGDLWWNLNDAGYEVPYSFSCDSTQLPKHSLFAGALWLGGVDPGGQLYVVSQKYRQGGDLSFWPGALNDTAAISDTECLAWDNHYKINKDSVYVFRYKYLQGSITSINDIPDEIVYWPSRNNPNITDRDMNKPLAPFVDVNVDGNYNPLDGDYPDIMGDQSIWWVINDAGGIKSPLTPTIGLEVQIEAFAFRASNALNNATFYNYKIINKGSKTLNDTYIGQWVDPDIGQFDDDYVGCDVERGMGFCYNGDNYDEGVSGYGLNPPAIGIDIVKGILADPGDSTDNDRDGVTDEAGEQIIMSKFVYYNNDFSINGNPESAQHIYNYLQGIWKDGTKLTYDGGDGTNQAYPLCDFMFPGDTDPYGWGVGGSISNPISMPVWDENTAGNFPADRRFVMSFGPVTVLPGSVKDFTFAVPWAKASTGGVFASVEKLREADDIIQLMFDNNFVKLNGPAAPDITDQTDSTIILQFTLSQNYISILNDVPIQVNTITHQEGSGNRIYTFQGYQVFQLANQYVTLADLDDTTSALEVAQSDIADGIDTLSNLVWDFGSQSYVYKTMVKGANSGLQNTVTITTDAFTGNPLVDKMYYYMVIAYASADPLATDTSYVRGFGNVKVICATPVYPWIDPNDPDNPDTGLPVKRITGTGNMGRVLELSNESIDSILTNNYVTQPVYKSRFAPVNITVTDQSALSGNDFRLELSSYLAYENTSGTFNVGDTIIAGNFPFLTSPTVKSSFPQLPGEGIIRRIVQDSVTNGVLDIEVLNQSEGGTFVLEIDSFAQVAGPFGPQDVFVKYAIRSVPFSVKNSSVSAVSIDYKANDYWKLINVTNNDTIYAQYRISEGIQELISQYGIAIHTAHASNPGYKIRYFEGGRNAFQIEGTAIEFQDPQKKWLDGVSNKDIAWLLPLETALDIVGVYLNVLNGTWAPYHIAARVGDNGSWYQIGTRKIYNLNNVDIVITSDISKWTRCPVLQVAPQRGTNLNNRLLKNVDVPSVGKDGLPDGTLSPYRDSVSYGMGWFPGYAIDIDKGIRLSLAFAESSQDDAINGNDLIWQPDTTANGARSYIYITPFKYDGGDSLEYVFDSLIYSKMSLLNGVISPTIAFVIKDFYNELLWVGNPKLAAGHTLLETDVKIRLRVDRAYQAYGMDNTKANNPVYFFGSSITGIKEYELPGTNMVLMYPNPSLEAIYIRIRDINSKIRSFKLYDVNGQMVHSQKDIKTNTLRITRESFRSGMYFYRIISDNDKTFTGKLIFE